jgi:two-component system NarL family response regulator
MVSETRMVAEKPITIMICDDHPVVRDGLRAMLSAEPDFQVLGEAATGSDAVAMCRDLRPQVVIMDLLLPDMSGAEAIKQIHARSSSVQTLVLTTVAADEQIYRAIEAGARGYIFKDSLRHDLLDAIRTVSSGRRFIPREVGARLAERLPRSDLSEREISVLKLVAAGMRNKEIAFELNISEATVNVHIRHILEKLHASDRTQAVMIALRRGLIPL